MSEATLQEEQVMPIAWIGGMPLYLAPVDGTEEFVESIHEMGFQVFYMMANDTTTTEHKDAKTKVVTKSHTHRPKFFKVIKNIVGSATVPVDVADFGLGTLETSAYFHLPKIPYALVQDVEDFFREVDRIHKTEAIVIFTYDQTYLDSENPSDGWGVLVPEQTNSSVSCDYDETTVVDDIPDEKIHDIVKVGTAHSHPGMDAYCSGTDKADQAHFDGIHITFGWKSGQSIEHHIEIQMGGKGFSMKPEQVFADAPVRDNERLQPWTEKVTKAKAGVMSTWHDEWGDYAGTGYTGYGYYSHYNDDNKYKNLPKEVPFPTVATIVVETLDNSNELKQCPICETPVSGFTIERGRCTRCLVFLVCGDDTLDELIRRRESDRINSDDLRPELEPNKSIWIIEEMADDKTGEIKWVYWEQYQGKNSSGSSSAGKAPARSIR